MRVRLVVSGVYQGDILLLTLSIPIVNSLIKLQQKPGHKAQFGSSLSSGIISKHKYDVSSPLARSPDTNSYRETERAAQLVSSAGFALHFSIYILFCALSSPITTQPAGSWEADKLPSWFSPHIPVSTHVTP